MTAGILTAVGIVHVENTPRSRGAMFESPASLDSLLEFHPPFSSSPLPSSSRVKRASHLQWPTPLRRQVIVVLARRRKHPSRRPSSPASTPSTWRQARDSSRQKHRTRLLLLADHPRASELALSPQAGQLRVVLRRQANVPAADVST